MLLDKLHQIIHEDVYNPASYAVDVLGNAASRLESAHEITAHALNTDNEEAQKVMNSYTEAIRDLNEAGILVTEALHQLNTFLAKAGLPPFDVATFQMGRVTPNPESIYEPEALSHVDLVSIHPDVGPLAVKEKMHTNERLAAWRARVNFVAAVRSMGGIITEDKHGSVQPPPENTEENANQRHIVVRPDGGLDPTHPRLDNVQELVPGLAMPWEKPFLEFCDTEDTGPTLPYMLVIPMEDAGEGKYLIETTEQHEQAKSYITTLGEHNRYMRGVVAKEFIQTPSEHYTSYRLLVTGAGRVEAAGLLYSDQTEQEGRTVDKGVYGLSQPGSPHYLSARDVRSNLSQGGHVIPLIGDNRQPVSAHEQDILSAHGIDPDSPSIPEELQDKARAIAQAYGERIDAYAGLDFIQSSSGKFYFLEGNVGPGSKTYVACHNGGQPMSYVTIYDDIFGRLLEDLKQTKQP